MALRDDKLLGFRVLHDFPILIQEKHLYTPEVHSGLAIEIELHVEGDDSKGKGKGLTCSY
jgi:hypothetical protein